MKICGGNRLRFTLEKIGELAGVSRSTVSRVINGQRDVSEEVRTRVLETIERTGYRPNQAARTLVSSRSQVLGLVIPSSVHNLFADPYFGRLIQGITKAANRAEQTLSLFLFEDEREELDLYPRVVANGLLDGLIVTATKMADPLVQCLLDDDTNFVMIGRPDSNRISYVNVENESGARLATHHLLGHGAATIGAILPPSSTTTGVDRRTGFLAAMNEAGRAVPEGLMVEGDFTEESGYEGMSRLITQGVDAVFCGSDTMAIGALEALADAGVRCPEDVRVVSFDGLLDARQTDPPLTTVRQPVRQTGEEAVNMLLEILDDGDSLPRSRIFPTELTIRSSCGCPEQGGSA